MGQVLDGEHGILSGVDLWMGRRTYLGFNGHSDFLVRKDGAYPTGEPTYDACRGLGEAEARTSRNDPR